MPKAPACAPPALPFLRQAIEDLPKLQEAQRKAELRVQVWERNLNAAKADLMTIKEKVVRKQANIDAALATVRAQDQVTSASRSSRPVTPERPRPSKSRKMK